MWIATLLFVTCVAAQFEPATDPPEVTLEVFIKASENAKKRYYDKLIAEREASVPTKQQVARNPRLRSEQTKRLAQIAELRRMAEDPRVVYARIHLEDLKVGGIGQVAYLDWGFKEEQGPGLKILQIIDDTSLLGHIDGRTFYINKISTKGLADDGAFYLPGIWWVNGVYRYRAATGAQKTVFAVSPWEHDAKYRERIKQQSADIEAAMWRTWRIAGKDVRAKYNGTTSGTVHVILEDGTASRLPLARLPKEQQEWIKAEAWIKSKGDDAQSSPDAQPKTQTPKAP